MRRATFALVLCLATGCSRNIEQLQTLKSGLELERVEKKQVAQSMSERRREVLMLQSQIETRLKESGMRREDLRIAAPVPVESVAVPLHAAPPVSRWEGSRAAKLRAEIAYLNAELAELDKIVAEVRSLEEQKTQAEATLRAIADLKRVHDLNQANEAQ